MWKLVSKKTGNEIYMLSKNECYSVGRNNCDLNLKNDTSISRNHGVFKPSTNFVNVIDVGSKYNTYCNENIENNIPLEFNKPFKLRDGERVKFGRLENEFVLTRMKICTVPSTLNSNEKEKLIEILQVLKGQNENKITPECTHLTMNEITVTNKLLHALVDGIPIVTLKFWIDYLDALQKKSSNLPDPADYVPNIAESFLNINKEMLLFKEERKTLFNGKIFYFMNKTSYDTYSPIISKAGGESKTLNNKIQITYLAKKNAIVINYTSSTQSETSSQTSDRISEFLKQKDLRLIPEYEIGLALINCSIEKYCNTKYNFECDFKENHLQEIPESNNKLDVIAEDTPAQDTIRNKKDTHLPEIEIPESAVTMASAVYDITESDDEVSEIINIENIAQNSQEHLFNAIVEDEMQNIQQERNNEKTNDKKNDNSIEKSINDEIQHKRKRDSSPNMKQNKRVNLEIDNTIETIPNEEVMISKNKTSKSISGFLEKSLIRKENDNSKTKTNNSNTPNESQNNISQKKRRRFANLDDDDKDEDNDDDLFDFGRSQNKKQRTIINDSSDDQQQNDSDNENLFNIRKKNNPNRISQSLPSSSSSREINLLTQSTNVEISKSNNLNSLKNNSTKKQSYTKEWKKPNTPSQPISTLGWLSKEIIKIKIEDEVDLTVNNNTKSTTDPVDKTDEIDIKMKIKSEEDTKKWFDSIKDGIQVRVKSMVLVSKCSNPNMESICSDGSNKNLNTTNGKNFKAFVKKHNFKQQKAVVSTVPYHVTGFSF